MDNIFDQDLILQFIKYFKDRYGQDITTEQAVVFLSSLGELYLLVIGQAARRENSVIPTAAFPLLD